MEEMLIKILDLYPRSVFLSFLIKSMIFFSKKIKFGEKEGGEISEFKYTMD
jgi:hypothetical protein